MASLLIRHKRDDIIYKLKCYSIEEAYFLAAPLCLNPMSFMNIINHFSTTTGVLLNEDDFLLSRTDYIIHLYFSSYTDNNLPIMNINKYDLNKICQSIKEIEKRKSYLDFQNVLNSYDV
jgi:hypothetical protein